MHQRLSRPWIPGWCPPAKLDHYRPLSAGLTRADRPSAPIPAEIEGGPHPRTPGRDRAAAGADHLGCGAVVGQENERPLVDSSRPEGPVPRGLALANRLEVVSPRLRR